MPNGPVSSCAARSLWPVRPLRRSLAVMSGTSNITNLAGKKTPIEFGTVVRKCTPLVHGSKPDDQIRPSLDFHA